MLVLLLWRIAETFHMHTPPSPAAIARVALPPPRFAASTSSPQALPQRHLLLRTSAIAVSLVVIFEQAPCIRLLRPRERERARPSTTARRGFAAAPGTGGGARPQPKGSGSGRGHAHHPLVSILSMHRGYRARYIWEKDVHQPQRPTPSDSRRHQLQHSHSAVCSPQRAPAGPPHSADKRLHFRSCQGLDAGAGCCCTAASDCPY